MIPEIGQFALIIALLLALTQATLPLIGASRGNRTWIALAAPAGQAQFIFVTIAFCCLGYSFITNDFSVLNVATNSNSQLPLHYRLAATWGSHEGSLLLVDVDARALDCRRLAFQSSSSGRDGGARAERDGNRQRGLSAVHAAHFESFRASVACSA